MISLPQWSVLQSRLCWHRASGEHLLLGARGQVLVVMGCLVLPLPRVSEAKGPNWDPVRRMSAFSFIPSLNK